MLLSAGYIALSKFNGHCSSEADISCKIVCYARQIVASVAGNFGVNFQKYGFTMEAAKVRAK